MNGAPRSLVKQLVSVETKKKIHWLAPNENILVIQIFKKLFYGYSNENHLITEIWVSVDSVKILSIKCFFSLLYSLHRSRCMYPGLTIIFKNLTHLLTKSAWAHISVLYSTPFTYSSACTVLYCTCFMLRQYAALFKFFKMYNVRWNFLTHLRNN